MPSRTVSPLRAPFTLLSMLRSRNGDLSCMIMPLILSLTFPELAEARLAEGRRLNQSHMMAAGEMSTASRAGHPTRAPRPCGKASETLPE